MKKPKKMTINPNLIKSRDLVHLQEITHGSGAGFHKGKKDILLRQQKKQKESRYSDESGSYLLGS